MLPKIGRLSRVRFNQVKSASKVFHYSLFTLLASPNLPSGISVVVSTKVSKSAVKRNRIKRLIYLYFSSHSYPYSLIIYVRKSMLNLTREEIHSQLNSCLSKIPLS